MCDLINGMRLFSRRFQWRGRHKLNGATYIRANATLNTSGIFDGVLSLRQLPIAFNMHNLSTRRNASLSTAVSNQTRPTILNVESLPSPLIG